APGSAIPWVIEELSLFAASDLSEAQAGYRWTGAERTPSPAWHPEWVVIGSVFGDPFFVDTSHRDCPVLFARHGAERWSPVLVAPSMVAFIDGLARFEAILLGDFHRDVWTDDGLSRAFLDAVVSQLAEIWPHAQAVAFSSMLG